MFGPPFLLALWISDAFCFPGSAKTQQYSPNDLSKCRPGMWYSLDLAAAMPVLAYFAKKMRHLVAVA